MSTPTITAVIPTYRRPHLLKRAIRSVLNQTYPHLKVCVYDNASEDSTEETVKEFQKEDSRVYYYRHITNIGAWKNFAFGFDQVDTPLFSLLSDDDVLLPWFYEQAVKELTAYPDIAYFIGSTLFMKESGKTIAVPLELWNKTGVLSSWEAFLEMSGRGLARHSVWTATVFRREITKVIGGLDPTVTVFDSDFFIRATLQFPIFVSKNPCAIFLVHESSCSGGGDVHFIFSGWKKIIQKISENTVLSIETRNKVCKIIDYDLKNYLIRNVVSKTLQKRRTEAIQSLDLLSNHYKLRLTSHIVKVFLGIANFFFFSEKKQKLFSFLRKKKSQNLLKYDAYSKWL